MANCVTPEELVAYNQGKLSPEQLNEISDHLDRCASCALAASRVDSEADDLMRDLRAAGKSASKQVPSAGSEMATPRRVGEYELLDELGRGGMGVVYRARDRRLGRVVALKLLAGGTFADSSRRQRFRWEAEAVARLRHPGIVQIYEVGEHETPTGERYPFIALELVDGDSLSALLSTGPLTPAAAAMRVEEVARAAHCAHAHGIVHRDLKPTNVLLAADGKALLCDFGLAKAADGDGVRTETGIVVGTPEYMAPEQATGSKDIGPAADIYGLGALLYEALTGRPPFRGPTALDTMRLVLNEEPVPVRRLQPGVPRDLETICLKCLEKQPERRYRTAEDLADDLHRFVAGEPIRAVPTGPITRASKWVRRRPGLATMWAALALAIVAGVSGISWGLVRANRALAAERTQRQQAETSVALLESVFRRLDPLALGNDSIRDQLIGEMKRAEERVAQDFATAPLVRARLRMTLGITELGLGEPARAADLFQAVLDERESLLGTDHRDTWEARNRLAWAYRDLGRPADAIKLFESVRTWRESHLGADDPDTLDTFNGLAGAYHEAGREKDALDLWQKAFSISSRTRGPDHSDTAILEGNVALSYQALGRNAEAIPMLESLRDRQTKLLGAEHPRIFTLFNNLAAAYLAENQTDKAVPLFEQVYAQRLKKLGPNHQETLTALNNVAAGYHAEGRFADAVRSCERARDQLALALGPEHPNALALDGNLAWFYRDAGRQDDAAKLFARTRQTMDKALGAEHPFALDVATGCGQCQRDAGQFTEAITTLQDVLRARRKAAGLENADTLETMTILAGTLVDATRFEEALPLYREVIAVQERTLPADHTNTLKTRVDLASCYLQMHRFAQAESLLRPCLAAQEKSEPQAPSTFYTQSLLGASWLGQGQYAAAEAPLLAGYAGLNKVRRWLAAPLKVQLVQAAERLVKLYELTGNKSGADKWRREVESAKKNVAVLE
jgi:hypothetical protein